MKKVFYSLNFVVLLLLLVLVSVSGQEIGKVACKRLDEGCENDTSCCGEDITCEIAGNGNDTMVCVLREEEWCSKSRIGVACRTSLSCCGGRCLADASNNGMVCVEREEEQKCRHLNEACRADKGCCGEGTTCEVVGNGNNTKVCVLRKERWCSKGRVGVACLNSLSCCGGRCLADANNRTVCVDANSVDVPVDMPKCRDIGDACNDGGICCFGRCGAAGENKSQVCIWPFDQVSIRPLCSDIGEFCVPLLGCCDEKATCEPSGDNMNENVCVFPVNEVDAVLPVPDVSIPASCALIGQFCTPGGSRECCDKEATCNFWCIPKRS